jgi:nucleoside-diphosphate-sugar epimerase
METVDMNERKTVLITGACGFLGLQTTRLFLSDGYHVILLDLPRAIDSCPLDIVNHEQSESISLDLVLDEIHLPDSIDYVVHLAGLASAPDSFERPADYEQVNVQGTINILNALKGKSIRKFVFASTASVYGPHSTERLDESNPVNPSSPYAKSKAQAEIHVRKIGEDLGFVSVILRFFNIYGPGQKIEEPGIVTTFIRSMLTEQRIVIIGEGKRTRSFIHVRDCARAIHLSCTEPTDRSTTVNICADTSTSIKEIAELLILSSQRDDICIEHKPADSRLAQRSGCSGNLARTLLCFEAQIPLLEGLKETYDFFSSHKSQ